MALPLCGWAPPHWVGGGRPLPGAPSPPGESLLTSVMHAGFRIAKPVMRYLEDVPLVSQLAG